MPEACSLQKFTASEPTALDHQHSGWRRFPPEVSLQAWAGHASRAARVCLAEAPAGSWRHGDTWFVGVDALPNGPDGALPGGPPLTGAAVEFARANSPAGEPWHRAQLSVCRPGYPRDDGRESVAAHRYRRERAGAHLDGLLPVGVERRRQLIEPHAFVFGVGLFGGGAERAPLWVWPRSHRALGAAMREALQPLPVATWPEQDLSEVYQSARRSVLQSIEPVAVPLAAGESLWLHRHLLHGIGPWPEPSHRDDHSCEALRATAWFRPHCVDPADWLREA